MFAPIQSREVEKLRLRKIKEERKNLYRLHFDITIKGVTEEILYYFIQKNGQMLLAGCSFAENPMRAIEAENAYDIFENHYHQNGLKLMLNGFEKEG